MVICILTGYRFCIHLRTKTAYEVVQAYIDEVYVKFVGSVNIFSDNRTEFKNQLFTDVATQLGVECKVYSTLTILNQMEELKDSIIFLRHVCLNMYQNLLNWTKWCHWLALLWQMGTQRKVPFSSCLIEILLSH